ncbi:MAG: glycosyltransferase family 2 protein [Candidatus Saccharimonadales bacterium]
MKLVIFSICHNEAETIGDLLDRIPGKIPGIDKIETWVIDDGSTDDTAQIAAKHGAKVHRGISQKRLAYRFQQALEITLNRGADIVVNIDGDLQFRPEDIPKLVKPIIENGYDFVAADRFTDAKTGKTIRPKNMPASKYYANRIGTKIVSNLTRQKFNDVTCGFRAYNKKALLALNINSQYTYTQESFQMLAMKKMDIKAVPVEVTYYPGRKSRVVTSFFGFMARSAMNIIRAYRDFAPLRFFGTLGLISFAAGAASLIFLFIHWLTTKQFSPYKFVGFVGLYLISLALLIWTVGLVADMLDRLLSNQEKIIEMTKKQRYGSKSDKPQD